MSYCAKCGAELPAGAAFCPRCGTAAAAAATPPPAAPPAPAPPPPTARETTPPAATPPAATPPPATPPEATPAAAPPQGHLNPHAAARSAPPPPPPAGAAPHMSAQPRLKPGGRGWWIAPAIVVGIVLIAWLVLAGMPFGRDDERPQTAAPATETIAEATAPAETGTLIEEVPGAADDTFDVTTTTTVAPPIATAPAPANTAPAAPPAATAPTATAPPATTPPPASVQPPPVTRRPAPRREEPRPQPRREPAPARGERSGEISEAEATATLRSYVNSTDYYDTPDGCSIRVYSRGYRNVGYDLEVWQACGSSSRRLGRWRVDSKTREVFRQREDGRYLRP